MTDAIARIPAAPGQAATGQGGAKPPMERPVRPPATGTPDAAGISPKGREDALRLLERILQDTTRVGRETPLPAGPPAPVSPIIVAGLLFHAIDKRRIAPLLRNRGAVGVNGLEKLGDELLSAVERGGRETKDILVTLDSLNDRVNADIEATVSILSDRLATRLVESRVSLGDHATP